MLHLTERSWKAPIIKTKWSWRLQRNNWRGFLRWSNTQWESNLPFLPPGILPLQVKKNSLELFNCFFFLLNKLFIDGMLHFLSKNLKDNGQASKGTCPTAYQYQVHKDWCWGELSLQFYSLVVVWTCAFFFEMTNVHLG